MRKDELTIKLDRLLDTAPILEIVDEIEAMRLTIEEDELLIHFVNRVRQRVQQEAVNAVIDNGGKGLVAMATGSGKSKVAIDLAKYYSLQGDSSYQDATITPELLVKNKVIVNHSLIVPTEKLRDENWHEEYKKWNANEVYNITQRLCYASASKINGQEFDLVILDECHNITELSATFFDNNEVENIIALTATVPTDQEKLALLEKIGLKVVYHLSLDNAVKLGFVAPYKITVVYTELANGVKDIVSGSKAKPFLQNEAQKYAYLDIKWNTEKTQYGRATMPTTLNRMRFIYNLKSKTEAIRMIKNNLIREGERTLIFCGSIEQTKAISHHQFHSKTTDYSYNAFKTKEINELACVNAANEGHNFEDVDNMIIGQVQSGEKTLIQRLGRGIRFRIGHEAHLWMVVCKGTQDEVWVKSAMRNLDENRIEYIDYSELKKQFV